MSGGTNVWGDKCPGGQMSGGTNVWGDKCPGGKDVLGGHLSRGTNVGGTLVHGNKCRGDSFRGDKCHTTCVKTILVSSMEVNLLLAKTVSLAFVKFMVSSKIFNP